MNSLKVMLSEEHDMIYATHIESEEDANIIFHSMIASREAFPECIEKPVMMNVNNEWFFVACNIQEYGSAIYLAPYLLDVVNATIKAVVEKDFDLLYLAVDAAETMCIRLGDEL